MLVPRATRWRQRLEATTSDGVVEVRIPIRDEPKKEVGHDQPDGWLTRPTPL